MNSRKPARLRAQGFSRHVPKAQLEQLESRLLMHAGLFYHNHYQPVLPEGVEAHFDDFYPGIAADAAASTTPTLAAALVPLTSIPMLHSRPAAAAKLYLDFNGAAAMTWGSYNVTATPAYSTDSDTTTFSDAEIANIQEIWARVSEKYSPFNIDVTTQDPGSYTAKTALRVVIGGNGAWTGNPNTGGVSYINVFGTGYAGNTAWVFEDNLGGARYVAEAAAHEAGHAFGLHHQSAYSGSTKTAEYNPGNSLVAPIMGNSYGAQRGLWFYGTTSSSTTYQDNMAVLANATNGFGYRADDHAGATTGGTPLNVSGSSFSGSGVIEKTTDTDAFSFSTAAGVVTLNGNVNSVGAMLDLKLSLYNSYGALLAAADTTSLGESISLSLPGGTYTVVVGSHGSYGDVGQYTITGTLVPSGLTAPAAPTGLVATPGSTSVTLAWTDNALNETGYVVQRSTDGGVTFVNIASLGTDAQTYVDPSVTGGATYTYRVFATGAGGNSAVSNTATATIPVIVVAPATPTGLVVTGTTSSSISLKWNDLANETSYKVERTTDGVNWVVVATTAQNVVTFTNSGLASSTTYGYRVSAGNSAGTSGASASVSATTLAPVVSTFNAPSNLTALKGTTAGQIKLNWTDNSTTETSFRVEIFEKNKWRVVANVGANVTSLTVSGLSSGKTYSFRVAAYNGTTYTAWSNTATTTAAAPVKSAPVKSAWGFSLLRR